MAKRTEKHDDMSLLNNRILSLMVEKGDSYNSARKLANALYEGRYFKDMEYHFDKGESDLKQKDIWRIEKHIIKHLNAIDVRKINGEYLTIYSQFFNCSTDYILGLTDVKTNNADIRHICEVTGLSEKAITNIVTINNDEISEIPLNIYNDLFSVLLGNENVDELRFDWIRLSSNKSKYYEELAEINAWDDTKDKVPENERAVYEAQIESIRKNIDLNMDSYYGRLNKLSTEFLSIIDKGIQKKLTDEYYDGLYKKELDFLIRVFLKNK